MGKKKGRAFQDQKIACLPASLPSSLSLFHCYARAAARTGNLIVCMHTFIYERVHTGESAGAMREMKEKEGSVCVCVLCDMPVFAQIFR